jgi:hypothetical protein
VKNAVGQVESYSTFTCDTMFDVWLLLTPFTAIWFRCLVKNVHKLNPLTGKDYTWYEMSFFGRWEPDHSMVLCIDTPEDFRSQLEQSIAKGEDMIDLSNPFALYVPLVDQIVDLYDRSVWGIRDLIRTVEKVPFPCSQANNISIADCLWKAQRRGHRDQFLKA